MKNIYYFEEICRNFDRLANLLQPCTKCEKSFRLAIADIEVLIFTYFEDPAHPPIYSDGIAFSTRVKFD